MVSVRVVEIGQGHFEAAHPQDQPDQTSGLPFWATQAAGRPVWPVPAVRGLAALVRLFSPGPALQALLIGCFLYI